MPKKICKRLSSTLSQRRSKYSFFFFGPDLTEKHSRDISLAAAQYCDTAFADIYDRHILLFTTDFAEKADLDSFLHNILELLPEGTCISVFTNQHTTTDVRRDYVLYRLCLADARKIQPQRKVFYANEIKFAQHCRKVIDSGELSVQESLSALDPLRSATDPEELMDTLGIYLLDTDRSVQACSALLFVHKNTVKYRIKVIADKLGYMPGELPGSARLCVASAVRRLIG